MSAKALVIVEGSKLEPAFFAQVQNVFGIKMEIVPYCGNIGMLYDQMEKFGFDADIKDLLRVRKNGESDADYEKRTSCLAQLFSEVHLILDYDPQHNIVIRDGKDIARIALQNAKAILDKVRKMLEIMNEETEPTRGKLHINYPSMEAFRDADKFFDGSYRDNFVRLIDIVQQGYKQIVGRRKLANSKHLSAYTRENFCSLMRMGICKLNFICRGEWTMPTYDDYCLIASQLFIAERQREFIDTDMRIAVLNTAIMFLVDYKGRKLYEELVNTPNDE